MEGAPLTSFDEPFTGDVPYDIGDTVASTINPTLFAEVIGIDRARGGPNWLVRVRLDDGSEIDWFGPYTAKAERPAPESDTAEG